MELGTIISPSISTAVASGPEKRIFTQTSSTAIKDAIMGGLTSSFHWILVLSPRLFSIAMPRVYARILNGMFKSAA